MDTAHQVRSVALYLVQPVRSPALLVDKEVVALMNLVSFSIKTKGIHNFARRLRTVFSRFGFSETPTRRALYTVTETLQRYNGAPTFFIPAVVLRRHPTLIAEVAHCGAE